MRQVTLLFLLNDDSQEILLAMKKRGFGMGKLNGVGGKINQGEGTEEATIREAQEEIGVAVAEKDLAVAAELAFHFAGKPDWALNCHVFFTRTWSGTPQESEEMSPEWFSLAEIPYEKMWIDDKYWLPLALQGDFIKGEFNFNHDGSSLLQYRIEGAPR